MTATNQAGAPPSSSARLQKRAGCAAVLPQLALSLVSVALLLGMFEGFAYLWEKKQANGPFAWEMVASRRIEYTLHPDPPPGFTLMQPGSRYEFQGISVDINARGLRGPEKDYQPPPGTTRILNLGDSVAMGWGVAYEDTYGYQLERLLQQNSSGPQGFEVVTAAVPGWNLENELAYLQAEGLKYQPDYVLLDLTLVNDIYGKNALLRQDRPPLIDWLRANTYFWPFLRVQMQWIEAKSQNRERIEVIDPPTRASSYFPVDPADERWEKIWTMILDIQQQAEENGAQFILVIFPLEFQVLDESFTTLPQDLLKAKAAEAGFPVVDLLPVYRRACLEKPGGPCTLEDRYLFADVWMHPSPLGHELAAQALLPLFDAIGE